TQDRGREDVTGPAPGPSAAAPPVPAAQPVDLGPQLPRAQGTQPQRVDGARLLQQVGGDDQALAQQPLLFLLVQRRQHGDRMQAGAVDALAQAVALRMVPAQQVEPGAAAVGERVLGEATVRYQPERPPAGAGEVAGARADVERDLDVDLAVALAAELALGEHAFAAALRQHV